MPDIKDYGSKILINGVELLDFSSFTLTEQHGKAETDFSVDLHRPINLPLDSLISISDGFNNQLVPLLQNRQIEGVAGSIHQTNITGQASTLTLRAPSKSIVFVNQTWLQQRCATYWLYNTGADAQGTPSTIIMVGKPAFYANKPVQLEGVSVARLMLEELPGKNVKDTEFGCIVKSGVTHHDIGRKICELAGYSLVVNTPNLPIQKTYMVSSSTTYWQALAQLFSIWRPMMFVRGTIVYVFDIGIDRQAKANGETISLTESAFSVYEWHNQKNLNPTDHILITGPDAQYTYTSRSTSITKRQYSDVDLPGQDITEQYEEKEEYMGDDELQYTLWVLGAQDRSTRIVRTIKKRIDPNNPSNSATVHETIQNYNASDVLLSQTDTDYKYAAFNKPTKSITTEYGRVGRVGGGTNDSWTNGCKQTFALNYDWLKLSETTITYRDYFEEVGQVETDLVQKCLCVSYKDTEQHDGTTYDVYDQTKPMWQALQAGDAICEAQDSNGLGWTTAWQIYKRETIRFDKASPVLYRKTRTTRTYFPIPITKPVYEDIPIPTSKHNSIIHRKWEYFWIGNAPQAYTGGSYPTIAGGFHPRVDISHPDIVTDQAALQVAYRQMTGYQITTQSATIELTIPLNNILIGGTIALPACTKEFWNYHIGAWDTVTIPAQTYWIVGKTRVVTYGGDVGSPGRTIDIKTRIELKEFF